MDQKHENITIAMRMLERGSRVYWIGNVAAQYWICSLHNLASRCFVDPMCRPIEKAETWSL